MTGNEQQARLEEAFERIEETILPCIAMMLESLLDAAEGARIRQVCVRYLRGAPVAAGPRRRRSGAPG